MAVERDPNDPRWIHYPIDRNALAEIHRSLARYFDPERIESRNPTCGPRGSGR